MGGATTWELILYVGVPVLVVGIGAVLVMCCDLWKPKGRCAEPCCACCKRTPSGTDPPARIPPQHQHGNSDHPPHGHHHHSGSPNGPRPGHPWTNDQQWGDSDTEDPAPAHFGDDGHPPQEDSKSSTAYGDKIVQTVTYPFRWMLGMK